MINTGVKMERMREEVVAPEVDRAVQATNSSETNLSMLMTRGIQKSYQTGMIKNTNTRDRDDSMNTPWNSYIDINIAPVEISKAEVTIRSTSNSAYRSSSVYVPAGVNCGRLINSTKLRIYANDYGGNDQTIYISNVIWEVRELY